jgi:hypothetical protein
MHTQKRDRITSGTLAFAVARFFADRARTCEIEIYAPAKVAGARAACAGRTQAAASSIVGFSNPEPMILLYKAAFGGVGRLTDFSVAGNASRRILLPVPA